MKSNCEFTVIGLGMTCPACGEAVPANHRHECEWDDVVGTRRTMPIQGSLKALVPKPKKRKPLAPSGGRE